MMKRRRKLRIAVVLLCCFAIVMAGCSKESKNIATASFDYEPFDITLEQKVNRDDRIQVEVTLTLPDGTTWGDFVEDPVPEDDIESILVVTYAYNLFQTHLTETDLAERRGYDEIIADTDFMEQYNGLREYPGIKTLAVNLNSTSSKNTFTFDKDEIDLENEKMSLVLPFYYVKYADTDVHLDLIIKEFEGPFILNWNAVYE